LALRFLATQILPRESPEGVSAPNGVPESTPEDTTLAIR
jgi:hypothetical protein